MTENRFSGNQIKRKPDALLLGMHARHKRVAPHESEHYQYERDAGHPGHFSSAPFHPQPLMQIDGVHNPGDQRPGLFRIPAPEGRPGLFRPDAAREDDDTQHQETERDQSVGKIVHLGQMLFIRLFLNDPITSAHYRYKCKGGIGQCRRADMQAKPRTFQRRHKLSNFLRL